MDLPFLSIKNRYIQLSKFVANGNFIADSHYICNMRPLLAFIIIFINQPEQP